MEAQSPPCHTNFLLGCGMLSVGFLNQLPVIDNIHKVSLERRVNRLVLHSLLHAIIPSEEVRNQGNCVQGVRDHRETDETHLLAPHVICRIHEDNGHTKGHDTEKGNSEACEGDARH